MDGFTVIRGDDGSWFLGQSRAAILLVDADHANREDINQILAGLGISTRDLHFASGGIREEFEVMLGLRD